MDDEPEQEASGGATQEAAASATQPEAGCTNEDWRLRSKREQLWIRVNLLPEWVFWLLGYLVIVPAGYVIGLGGIAGDLASSPEDGGFSIALAAALGWTILSLTTLRNDAD